MIHKIVYKTVRKQFIVSKIEAGSKSWFHEIAVRHFVGWPQNGL